ncbi:MAG: ATP-binding protein [Candidatus Omnitrophica bacterium]|nr:ATP-binding protein [Candidatus Omnitrophota bacterium]
MQKVVQEHEGKIMVRSRLKEGTTFTIQLPVRKNS